MMATASEEHDGNSKALALRTSVIEITEEAADRAGRDVKALTRYYKSVMQEGTDYGTLPGTQKPSLWKPGAEILARSIGLSVITDIVNKVERVDGSPFFLYTAESRVYNLEGGLLGNGFGTASTGEERYSHRWVSESKVPKSLDKAQLESEERKGTYGYYRAYRVDVSKEEVFTLANTVIKMAKKRAFVDAVLSVTGASRIFTQDVEDEQLSEEDTPPGLRPPTGPTQPQSGHPLGPPKAFPPQIKLIEDAIGKSEQNVQKVTNFLREKGLKHPGELNSEQATELIDALQAKEAKA